MFSISTDPARMRKVDKRDECSAQHKYQDFFLDPYHGKLAISFGRLFLELLDLALLLFDLGL